MQIVFLVHDIHLGAGGERVTVNLANYLAAKEYSVSITSIASFKPKNIFNLDNRVALNYLNINYGSNILNKIASVIKVRSHFKNNKDHIIISGIGTYPSLLLALLPKKNNRKTIGCHHLAFSAVPYGWRMLSRFFFHRLNCLISLTKKDVHRLELLNKKVRVIPNAVSFYPENHALLNYKIILAVGRLEYVKGYDLLLDVFERFSTRNKDWNLRIIGDGPLKSYIASRVSISGLKERVTILPSTDSIVDEYLNSSVYIMSSRAEGFPMVLLEAQACGLPIISFNCESGPAEIVNSGKDGFLIDDFDVEEMALKLEELCSDIDKRKEFGRNARENSRNFFPGKIFVQWEELFEELRIKN